MYRIKEDHMEELEIKKSKFICYLHKCFHEEDAKAFIQQIKKEHPNANHHCYAFIMGEQNETQRSNDDGEPSGTAGVPMLECLAHRELTDIVAVTVRYFGGIKLGAGGLIRAYSKSVAHALDCALLTKKQKMLQYNLTFSYDLIGKLDYFFRNENIEILEKDFQESVTYTFLCLNEMNDKISQLTNGKFLPSFEKECMIEVAIPSNVDLSKE